MSQVALIQPVNSDYFQPRNQVPQYLSLPMEWVIVLINVIKFTKEQGRKCEGAGKAEDRKADLEQLRVTGVAARER